MVLAQLLKARMQISNVRRHARNALAIQFQHHAQCCVRGGMRWTKIQYPSIGRLDMVLQVVRIFDIKAVGLVGRQCVGHGTVSIDRNVQ